MKFSKKSEYAMRALLDLADRGRRAPVPREEISQRHRIPLSFLEQVLLPLKHAGLVTSRRGVKGGYQLVRPARQITLGQVIRVMDGPLAPIGCASVTAYHRCDDCPYTEEVRACPVQKVMLKVRNAVSTILDHFTLQDFARPPRARGKRRRS